MSVGPTVLPNPRVSGCLLLVLLAVGLWPTWSFSGHVNRLPIYPACPIRTGSCASRCIPLVQKSSRAISAASSDSAPMGKKGDSSFLISAFAVLGKSTRWTVAGLVGLTLLIRRDATMVNFTGGAILNAFLGKILKRIIRQERPDGAVLEDHGMPSSHAMSLFYMTTYVIAVLLRGVPAWWPVSVMPTIGLLLAYVLTASYWRIYSGLHTFPQILAGVVGGSTVGLAWERLSHQVLNQRLGALLAGYPKSQVPIPYIASVMVVGALTVGSVERKIGKLIRSLRQKRS